MVAWIIVGVLLCIVFLLWLVIRQWQIAYSKVHRYERPLIVYDKEGWVRVTTHSRQRILLPPIYFQVREPIPPEEPQLPKNYPIGVNEPDSQKEKED